MQPSGKTLAFVATQLSDARSRIAGVESRATADFVTRLSDCIGCVECAIVDMRALALAIPVVPQVAAAFIEAALACRP